MALVPDRSKVYKEEIAKCSDDFFYFCTHHLKIIDRNGNIVPLKLKPSQKKLLLAIDKNPWQIVLKARQLGSSTLIAAFFFWKTLFTPNERTLIVAHTHDAVKNIFRIYNTFYDNLPKFLQFSTKTASANEIIFFHGGTIRVTSAGSAGSRGATYNNIHGSEVAFWKDLNISLAALLQTATGNSCIILETTANGLNAFHTLWSDDTVGYSRTFLSWTDEPEYILLDNIVIPEQIRDYAAEHKLTKEQTNWAAQTLAVKCANSFVIFQQEYAIDAITCFISSGTRYFDVVYPDALFEKGYKVYEKYNRLFSYIIGVDTASGSSKGDYSAFVVTNVINKERPVIVATYAERITPIEFAKRVLQECKKWDALAVIESNSYGLAVIEVVRNEGWSKLYTKQTYDKVNDSWTETLGFNTNASSRPLLFSTLQQFINSNNIEIIDERLQSQINTFIYDEKGKPDHIANSHDDLLVSLGLTLMGMEQAQIEDYSNNKMMPRSISEMVQLEIQAGTTIKKLAQEGYFSDYVEKSVPSISRIQWTK